MQQSQQPGGTAAAAEGRFARTARNGILAALVMFAAVGCVPIPPAVEIAGNTPATSDEAAAECPPEKIAVTDLTWFQDAEGAWRVAGWINNGWDQPISKIVTDTEAVDDAGQVIDHGEDISVYPLNLKTGARAPFIAWIKRDFPGTKRFQVEVSECIVAEQQERSAVEVRKDELSFGSDGRGHVTGELVNTGAKPVLVNGLTAALLDAQGKPVAAEDAAVSARYLGPGEHGPFRVTLVLPPGAASAVREYRLYMDPVVTEPRPPLVEAGTDLRVTRQYVDGDGRFHLTGDVTNRGDANLTLRLQATLYDGPDRTKVVDAAFLDTAPPLKPGETRSVDFTNWGPVNGQQGLAGQLLERKAAADVRVELLQSWSEAAQP